MRLYECGYLNTDYFIGLANSHTTVHGFITYCRSRGLFSEACSYYSNSLRGSCTFHTNDGGGLFHFFRLSKVVFKSDPDHPVYNFFGIKIMPPDNPNLPCDKACMHTWLRLCPLFIFQKQTEPTIYIYPTLHFSYSHIWMVPLNKGLLTIQVEIILKRTE